MTNFDWKLDFQKIKFDYSPGIQRFLLRAALLWKIISLVTCLTLDFLRRLHKRIGSQRFFSSLLLSLHLIKTASESLKYQFHKTD
jgi:hypothetical protein